ncbi:hypothetical protein [Castellaniella sp.]
MRYVIGVLQLARASRNCIRKFSIGAGLHISQALHAGEIGFAGFNDKK